MPDSTYQEALDYLYSFVDYSLTRSFRFTPDKFDLGRMRALLSQLGNPEIKYPIIHIAGTKGKGSVSAMCSSILKAGGYQVGLYTSPHLHDYSERIQVGGHPIPHSKLVELIDDIKPIIVSIEHLTTFEITTALALLYFARQHVDAVVLEVGLGGRLDATNVVTPIVSVITSLSLDHTQILGYTLAEIAREKAGIIKKGVPIVLAPQQDEARQVVRKVAVEQSAKLIEIGKDYQFKRIEYSLDGQTLLVWSNNFLAEVEDQKSKFDCAESHEPAELRIPLLGYHQVENAATAYATMDVFRKSSLTISDTQMREGFSQSYWPARFEILQRRPTVIIDAAHNRDSAHKLVLTLEEHFPNEEVILLFGASEDKDLVGMFSELLPRVRNVIGTQSYHPRALEVEKIEAVARQFNKPVTIIPDVAEALGEAIRLASDNKIVLVTGSIFIAAGAREAWLANHWSPTLDQDY